MSILRALPGMLCAVLLAASAAFAQSAPIDRARDLQGAAPLETVKGDPEPDPAGPAGDPRFAAAIAYGAATDSDALLVAQQDRLLLAHDYPPHGADARSWSASMQKTLVALLTEIAIDRGEIPSVDQPAARWLPEWNDDAHRRITLRHLLTMTSGLDHPPFGSPKALTLVLGPDMTSALLALAATEPPGRTFDYDTSNAEIMMIVLERAAHQRLSALLSERLWQPLHLADAQLSLDHPGGLARPTLYARARDWLAIGELILHRGEGHGRRIVSPEWIDAMSAPSPRNPNYGFFLWRGSPPGTERSYGPYVVFKAHHSAPYIAGDIVYLDGAGGERVYVVPSRSLVIVRTGGARADWDDAVLPNAIVQGLDGK